MQSKQRKRQVRDTNERDDALIDILAERMAKKKEEDNQPDRLFLMSLVEEFGSIHPDYKMDARVEILNTIKKFKQMSRSSVQNNCSGYYTTTGWQCLSPSAHMQTSNRDYMPTHSSSYHTQNPLQNVTIPPQPSPSEQSGETSQNSSEFFGDLYD